MTTTTQFIIRLLFIAAGASIASLAAGKHAHAETLHDHLVQAASAVAPSLPHKIDDHVTQTEVHVDGLQLTNINTVDIPNLNTSQTYLTQRDCNDKEMHDLIMQGVSFRYIYWHKSTFLNRFTIHTLLGDFTVSAASCKAVASVQTPTAPIAPAAPMTPALPAMPSATPSSVGIVLQGSRAFVPMTVGSQAVYALVDTGCTSMTVTTALSNQLLAAGQATRLADVSATFADGSRKPVAMLNIDSINIGGHVLTNVEAMVTPDGSDMLLGFAVLKRISGKFAINTTSSTLEFY